MRTPKKKKIVEKNILVICKGKSDTFVFPLYYYCMDGFLVTPLRAENKIMSSEMKVIKIASKYGCYRLPEPQKHSFKSSLPKKLKGI